VYIKITIFASWNGNNKNGISGFGVRVLKLGSLRNAVKLVKVGLLWISNYSW
jgi:hypothetical protein